MKVEKPRKTASGVSHQFAGAGGLAEARAH